MLPLVDKPAIQYVVEEAVRRHPRHPRHHRPGQASLEDHFDRSFELEFYLEARGKLDQLKEMRAIAEMADIHYVRQGEPLGLGHAVAVAADHVGDEPFVVLLGDDVMSGSSRVLAEMLAVHERYGALWWRSKRCPEARFGLRLVPEAVEDGLVRILDIVEKPPPRRRRRTWP